MDISIEWHGDNFNVNLASKEGAEAFLSIKGCRIVDGTKGAFVSYPAKKLESGKYWNHCWGSERFNAVVLEKALATRPAPSKSPRGRPQEPDDDIPF